MALTLVFLPAHAHAAAPAAQEKLILVTGFEPFGGDATNGSWEAVKGLDGRHFGNSVVVAARLPVVWGKAAKKLRQLVRFYKPAAVISFGQAGAGPVRLETTARNVRGAIPDNEGMLPQAGIVYVGSPQTLETTLPAPGIMVRLLAAGIPAEQSQDAGNYLCNDTFYNLMFNPGLNSAKMAPRGFIHVPPLGSRVITSGGKTVVFNRQLLQRAAEIIVNTVAESVNQEN